MEVDSFKAFSSSHPVDRLDKNFWAIFDHLFEVANDRSIDRPLLAKVAGDLVLAAVPTVDSDGNEVDIEDFVREVQARIARSYEKMPFHDYTKVEVPNGNGKKTERWPLWLLYDNERPVPSATRPKGTKPFMNTLSISAIATTIMTPKSDGDRETCTFLVEEMARNLEPLKAEYAPNKGGFAFMDAHEQATEVSPISVPATIGGLYHARGYDRPDARIAERFENSIAEQLGQAWGERWDKLGFSQKSQIIDGLRERAPFSPAILTSHELVGVITAMDVSGAQLAQFPIPQALFLPPMPIVR
jgi:hypothetical protein